MRKVYGRHGKAAAQAEGQKDVERMLNDIGLGQANARLEKMNGTAFDLVISSPAPRAHKTAEIVTGWPGSDIVIIDSLYPAPDDGGVGARLDVLFQKLMYKPVSDYLKEEDGAAVTEWAQQAHAEVQQEIDRAGNPQTVGIFGHAVCSQALAMQDCIDNPALLEKIAAINLGECHLVIVDFDESGKAVEVTHVCD